MGDAAVTDTLQTALTEAERLVTTLVAGHQGRSVPENKADYVKRLLQILYTAKVRGSS